MQSLVSHSVLNPQYIRALKEKSLIEKALHVTFTVQCERPNKANIPFLPSVPHSVASYCVPHQFFTSLASDKLLGTLGMCHRSRPDAARHQSPMLVARWGPKVDIMEC